MSSGGAEQSHTHHAYFSGENWSQSEPSGSPIEHSDATKDGPVPQDANPSVDSPEVAQSAVALIASASETGGSPSKLRILRPAAPPVIDPLASAGPESGAAVRASASAAPQLQDRDAAEAELLGTTTAAETLTPVAWRAAVGEAQSTRLFLRVLNLEEPTLNQHIADHIITDDAHLAALLDFITRPISRPTHAGAAWIGQFAVDVSGARAVAPSAGALDASTDRDTVSTSAACSADGLDRNRAASSHLMADGDASAALEQRFDSFSILHAASPMPVSHAPPALASGAGPSGSEAPEVQTPHRPDLEGTGDLSAFRYCSDVDSDSAASGSVGPSPGSSSAHAIPGAVIAAHAASFSAAVADVRYSASAAARSWHARSVNMPLSTRSEGSSGGAFDISGNSSSESGPAAALPVSVNVPMALRPVSMLFPRQGEEITALSQLQDAAAAIASADTSVSLLMQGVASLSVSSPAFKRISNPGDAAPIPADGGSPASFRSPAKRGGVPGEELRAPSAAEISRAIALEQAAVKRSFRAMRLLCANSEIADDILESHTADVTKHLFGAFSARCKGSLYHVCAVLQRLIQLAPVAFVEAVCHDSQRYVGAMLPYLHHPPVADTLAQIVCVSHLTSAQGGVGPQANLTSTGASNALAFGGLGGGMFGFGGGFLSGFADRQDSAFAGQLTLYGQRGVVVPQAARMAMWRSLSAWGFLSVLASHVHRSEYAPVRGHASAAADLLLHLARVASADPHGDLLLGVLSSGKGGSVPAHVSHHNHHGGGVVSAPLPASLVMRGLLHGACWPKPGVDFPVVSASLGGGGSSSASAGYCSGGDVPERQRECMRVAAELVRLSFLDTVPAAAEPGGMGGMGSNPLQPQRMVENKLARAAPVLASTVVAALPQIGFALCRVNAALSPGSSAGGARRGSLGVAGAATAAAAGAKKKRAKKKKAGAAGQGSSSASASATSAAIATAATGDEDEEDDAAAANTATTPKAAASKDESPRSSFGDQSPLFALAAAVSTPSLLQLSGESSPASSVQPSPALATATAASAAAGASKQLQQGSTQQTKRYAHPGHDYPAPFGLFRLSAAQLLASLVQRETVIPRPAPFPPPVTVTATTAATPPPTPDGALSENPSALDKARCDSTSGRSRTETGGGDEGASGSEDEGAEDGAGEALAADYGSGGEQGKSGGGKKKKNKSSRKSKSKKGASKHASGAVAVVAAQPATAKSGTAAGHHHGKAPDAVALLAARLDEEERPTEHVKVCVATLEALGQACALPTRRMRSGAQHSQSQRSSTGSAQRPMKRVLVSPARPDASAAAAASPVAEPATLAAAASSTPALNYDPAEFWPIIVSWVLQFSHTNLYHVAFFQLLRAALRLGHEATLRHMLQSGKLVGTFVSHYIESKPLPLPPQFGSGGDLAIEALPGFDIEPQQPQQRRLLNAAVGATAGVPSRAQRRTDASGARGAILRALNAVRLAGQAQAPGSFLAQHLRDHAKWATFLPQLTADTEITLKPIVPAPQRPNMESMYGGGSGGGGGDGGGLGSGLSSLASLLSSTSYSDIASGLAGFAGLRGGRNAAAAAAKKASEAAAAPASPLDLGSAFARELGFEGLVPFKDPLVPVPPAAAAAAAAGLHHHAGGRSVGPGGKGRRTSGGAAALTRGRTGSTESAGSSTGSVSSSASGVIAASGSARSVLSIDESPEPPLSAKALQAAAAALGGTGHQTFSRPPQQQQGAVSQAAALDFDDVD